MPVATASEEHAVTAVPGVVTADIQAGIEAHIERRTRDDGGYFRLAHGDSELKLKLVRVHTEFLSNLGPESHFACVDLADVSGDVYDVDFFMEGPAGDMTVTETSVHKINGQPYYLWKQESDGVWRRTPVEDASDRDLGVVRGRDTFEFSYRATVPNVTGSARMWIPVPDTDAYQTVTLVSSKFPVEPRALRDSEYGNMALLFELGPKESGQTIEVVYRVERREKAAYAAPVEETGAYLKPERLVPTNSRIEEIAERVLKGKRGDLVRARALYDHTIDELRYMKYGEGWGNGDVIYACDSRTGNCTEFHSYFIALARASGIPARFAIGASVPSERDYGGIDGYHCWAEFYAEGKWWPIDVSEADKYSSLSTYYFGHHPANRVEISRGRDLEFEAGADAGPINFLAYPYLEVDGEPVRIKADFSFKRLATRTGAASAE